LGRIANDSYTYKKENFMSKKTLCSIGKHKLKLISVNERTEPENSGKITCVFEVLDQENCKPLLRTFKLESKPFKNFTSRYCKSLDGNEVKIKQVLNELKKLQGSNFIARVDVAKNPSYMNITDFVA
jgi:hypothetical protein